MLEKCKNIEVEPYWNLKKNLSQEKLVKSVDFLGDFDVKLSLRFKKKSSSRIRYIIYYLHLIM